ncbi:transmembrane protein 272-like [Tachypleus tridentatus]|uniref:transmembrane protein 272-like n=1 Tax=Tachypleus tridentatus TaxID=6853 RepID=UPI003FD42EB6
MSMLARKGTMVHRKSTRRASQPAMRRASLVSIPSTPRRSITLTTGVGQRSHSLSLTSVNRENSPRTSLKSTRRASVTLEQAQPLGPGVAKPLEGGSPRSSTKSTPRYSLQEGENRKSAGSVTISIDDRRRLYLKSVHEESLKYTSYGSISYQLQEANHEATGSVDFICRVLTVICSSALLTAFLACFSVLPVLMMIFGIKYLQDCPKQPNIPVYLLVGGAFGLIKLISTGWRQTKGRHFEPPSEALTDGDVDEVLPTTSLKITDYALSIFLLVWFIMGNYWILSIYKPRYEPLLHDPNNWCAKSVYLFSVIHLYVSYGAVALLITLFSVLFLCIRTCGVCDQKV